MEAKKKILLVEDDEALAAVYKSRLEIEGFETRGVYNGEEATIQAGYDTASLFGAGAGSEAFDEPLSTADTVAIANLFIV